MVLARAIPDIVATLRVAQRWRLPVTAFGAGTGLEGGAIPVAGGISLDLGGMDQILRLSPEDLDATVEAGVHLRQLNARLGQEGLFFPVDPGSDPTLGGMAATRASGTNAVLYGTMRENTLGLTVVLAGGEVVRTGGRARKSAAGYDLTRLFVGSEGTLGVIAEVTLRVYGRPEAVAVAACALPNLGAAVQAVIEMIQSGIPLARIELLDEVMIDAVNRHSGLTHPVTPTLFLEFHGGPESVREQRREVTQLVARQGGQLQFAESPEGRARLWRARHQALYAARALRPGSTTWATDVCVPISQLAECIAATRAEVVASRLLAPIVGHVGDGNFHLTFVLDPGDPDEARRAAAVDRRMVERALAMGGTCSGEHGIGLGKRHFLQAEAGASLEVMRRLKTSLDPQGILNPGKVLDQAS
ncbi:MAG: FAD-binding oxidoreductase [Candidatus Dormibacteria bacterium]